MMSFAGL